MEFLGYEELLDLQQSLIQESGGLHGIRDDNGIRSAIEQPQATMFGADLYETLEVAMVVP